MANTTFPDDYQTFLDGVGALNFDITWVVETGCVFDVNFHDRLVISTITPIAVIVFLGATYGLAVRVHRRSDEALEVIWQKHLSVVLLVTFLVYSAVSTVVFQTFSCDSLDDGKTYLRADYEIDCDSPEHGFFKIYAGVMIAVYPLGIPAFYTFLLVRNRALLKDELRREEASATKPTSNLWKPYKPSLFYYEVIECARRVMLTGLVVFIYPNTAAQIALTLVMAFIFAIVSEVLRPYLSRWDAWLNRIAQVTVFLSMYLALLLKVDVSGEGADSQRMFEIVLIAAHVLMIFVVVVEAGVLAHALRTQVKRQEEPQPVRSSSVTSILEIDEPL